MLASEYEKGSPGYHPYWYAHVIDIFHARVRHIGPRSKSSEVQQIEFLFVRWFRPDRSMVGGWAAERLHRVEFLNEANELEDAFGFADPAHIVRGVHLIPAFAHGETSRLLGPSNYARRFQDDDEDWKYFYIRM